MPLQVIMQHHYHPPLHPHSNPPPTSSATTYHPIFHRLKSDTVRYASIGSTPASPGRSLRPNLLVETGYRPVDASDDPEDYEVDEALQPEWETRFVRCSYEMVRPSPANAAD